MCIVTLKFAELAYGSKSLGVCTYLKKGFFWRRGQTLSRLQAMWDVRVKETTYFFVLAMTSCFLCSLFQSGECSAKGLQGGIRLFWQFSNIKFYLISVLGYCSSSADQALHLIICLLMLLTCTFCDPPWVQPVPCFLLSTSVAWGHQPSFGRDSGHFNTLEV